MIQEDILTFLGNLWIKCGCKLSRASGLLDLGLSIAQYLIPQLKGITVTFRSDTNS